MKHQPVFLDFAAKTLVPAIAGTTTMTLFSYWVTQQENKNFNEPELLATIESKPFPHVTRKAALPAGWATHYIVGILMTVFINMIRQRAGKAVITRGLVSGSFAGLIAIPAWNILFRLLPARSFTYYKKFYLQLFAAHIVFALTVTYLQATLHKAGKRH